MADFRGFSPKNPQQSAPSAKSAVYLYRSSPCTAAHTACCTRSISGTRSRQKVARISRTTRTQRCLLASQFDRSGKELRVKPKPSLAQRQQKVGGGWNETRAFGVHNQPDRAFDRKTQADGKQARLSIVETGHGCRVKARQRDHGAFTLPKPVVRKASDLSLGRRFDRGKAHVARVDALGLQRAPHIQFNDHGTRDKNGGV